MTVLPWALLGHADILSNIRIICIYSCYLIISIQLTKITSYRLSECSFWIRMFGGIQYHYKISLPCKISQYINDVSSYIRNYIIWIMSKKLCTEELSLQEKTLRRNCSMSVRRMSYWVSVVTDLATHRRDKNGTSDIRRTTGMNNC